MAAGWRDNWLESTHKSEMKRINTLRRLGEIRKKIGGDNTVCIFLIYVVVRPVVRARCLC